MDEISPSASEEKISFTFDGESVEARKGQSIKTALFEAGFKTLARSKNLHRPRGGFCGDGYCQQCTVIVNGEVKQACITEVEDGMRVESVNTYPTARSDLRALVDYVPVGHGFQYHLFPPHDFLNQMYEKTLRQFGGYRSLPRRGREKFAPPRTETPDVLVVGGGLAGIVAAQTLSRSSELEVLLLERTALDPRYAGELEGTEIQVEEDCGVFGYYQEDGVFAAAKETLWKVEPRFAVLATGFRDRREIFANNDLPGIVSSRAARQLLTEGHRPASVVVYGDTRRAQRIVELARGTGCDVRHLSPETEIARARGGLSVEALEIVTDGKRQTVPCDLLVMAHGFSPNNGLLFQLGCAMEYDEERDAYLPSRSAAGETSKNGIFAIGEMIRPREPTDIRREAERAAQEVIDRAG